MKKLVCLLFFVAGASLFSLQKEYGRILPVPQGPLGLLGNIATGAALSYALISTTQLCHEASHALAFKCFYPEEPIKIYVGDYVKPEERVAKEKRALKLANMYITGLNPLKAHIAYAPAVSPRRYARAFIALVGPVAGLSTALFIKYLLHKQPFLPPTAKTFCMLAMYGIIGKELQQLIPYTYKNKQSDGYDVFKNIGITFNKPLNNAFMIAAAAAPFVTLLAGSYALKNSLTTKI